MAIKNKNKEQLKHDRELLAGLLKTHIISASKKVLADVLQGISTVDTLNAFKKMKSLDKITDNMGEDTALMFATQYNINFRKGEDDPKCIGTNSIVFYKDGTADELHKEDLRLPDSVHNFVIYKETPTGIVKITIPTIIGKRLANYLHDTTDKENKDCHDFAYYMTGMKSLAQKNGSTTEELVGKVIFDEKDLSIESMKPGDMIDMGRGEKSIHKAIYLGEGMYISKYGKGVKGPIMIGDFEHLSNAYPHDKLHLRRRWFDLSNKHILEDQRNDEQKEQMRKAQYWIENVV